MEAAAKHLPTGVLAWWNEDSCTREDDDVDYLCHVSRHINFRILLYSKNERVIPLGSWSVIFKKKRCAFCRLVAGTAQCALSGLEADQLQITDLGIVYELDEDPDLDHYTIHLQRTRLKLVLSMRDVYFLHMVLFKRLQMHLSQGLMTTGLSIPRSTLNS